MSSIAVVKPWDLRRQWGLDTFVETGCYQGASLTLAHWAGFTKMVSCDINRECVLACRQKFPQAAILHGESTQMLGPCMPALSPVLGRTLFWLDAHYPAYYGLPETTANRYPLPEELRLIRAGKTNWEHDVIAMDDLRVIRDPANPRWRAGELTGPEADLYVDITVEELYRPFAATHTLEFLHGEEGVLLLRPRS